MPNLANEFFCYDLSPLVDRFTLWACDAKQIPTEIRRQPQHLGLLSEDELLRWGEYCFEKDRDMFFVGRILIRSALSCCTEIHPSKWRLTNQRFGKPEISFPSLDQQVDFNISHSDGLVLCAVSQIGKIGIDVESIVRPNITADMISFALSPREIQSVRTVALRHLPFVFLRYWTLKEAYVKAVGYGLSLPPSDIDVLFSASGAISCTINGRSEIDKAEWRFGQFRLFDRFICSWARALDTASESDI